MYRPASPFSVPMYLLTPREEDAVGVTVKTFPPVPPTPTPEGMTPPAIFFCSFKTFGGTEKKVNDMIAVEDTATIETWYRPDITAKCRVALANDPAAVYEIMGTPEDIEMRHQFLKFKARRVKAGA